MIDHISLGVLDLDRSRSFYTAVLRPLGIVPHRSGADFQSYRRGRRDDFSIHQVDMLQWTRPTAHHHYAFDAPTREAVRGFHRAALVSGARDDGPPGPRPDYHPNYYAAYVIDPSGYRIEAVCHRPAALGRRRGGARTESRPGPRTPRGI